MDLKAIEFTARSLYKEHTGIDLDEFTFVSEETKHKHGLYYALFMPIVGSPGGDLSVSFKVELLMDPPESFTPEKITAYESLW